MDRYGDEHDYITPEYRKTLSHDIGTNTIDNMCDDKRYTTGDGVLGKVVLTVGLVCFVVMIILCSGGFILQVCNNELFEQIHSVFFIVCVVDVIITAICFFVSFFIYND